MKNIEKGYLPLAGVSRVSYDIFRKDFSQGCRYAANGYYVCPIESLNRINQDLVRSIYGYLGNKLKSIKKKVRNKRRIRSHVEAKLNEYKKNNFIKKFDNNDLNETIVNLHDIVSRDDSWQKLEKMVADFTQDSFLETNSQFEKYLSLIPLSVVFNQKRPLIDIVKFMGGSIDIRISIGFDNFRGSESPVSSLIEAKERIKLPINDEIDAIRKIEPDDEISKEDFILITRAVSKAFGWPLRVPI